MVSSNYFVGLYTRGSSWLPGKTIHEQPLEAHFAYMAALQDSHVLVLGGPFKDDEGALAVIEAVSLTGARLIVLINGFKPPSSRRATLQRVNCSDGTLYQGKSYAVPPPLSLGLDHEVPL